jgi:hypothetical protein
MLSVVKPSVVILNVVILSVIMLSVVAPDNHGGEGKIKRSFKLQSFADASDATRFVGPYSQHFIFSVNYKWAQ